jgi:preprotein translocase subunit YajC
MSKEQFHALQAGDRVKVGSTRATVSKVREGAVVVRFDNGRDATYYTAGAFLLHSEE